MRKAMYHILFSTTLALGTVAAPSMAQEAATGSQTPANAIPAQNENYTDAQLQNFIAASKQVTVLSQKYTPQIEETTDEQERQKIFQEVDKKMVSAVQKEGLTVQEFNNINQQLPQDPQLEQRVVEMLD